jgi:hypothetical protein
VLECRGNHSFSEEKVLRPSVTTGASNKIKWTKIKWTGNCSESLQKIRYRGDAAVGLIRDCERDDRNERATPATDSSRSMG